MALSVLFFAVSCAAALAKPFWFDELLTVYYTRLPTLAAMTAALPTGPDLHPPLHYWVVHFCILLFGAGELSLRMPSILAMGAGCAALYLVVRRRTPAAFAFLAAVLPLGTFAGAYAIEARPYAFFFAFAALAFLFWQRAAESEENRGFALFGLFLCFSGAILSHCYSVTLWFAFALGELVRFRRRRRADPLLWTALLAPALFAAWYYPALIHQSHNVNTHSWASPTLYRLFMELFSTVNLANQYLAIAVALALALSSRRKQPEISFRRGFASSIPAHEIAAAAGLAMLPFVDYVLAVTATGLYDQRYAIPFVAGLGILAGFFLCGRADDRLWRGWAPAAMFVMIWLNGGIEWIQKPDWAGAAITRPYAEALQSVDPQLPIVVSNPHLYLQLLYYASPAQMERTVSLSDLDASLRYTADETMDIEMAALARTVPVKHPRYRDFVPEHPRFLVYQPEGDDTPVWIPQQFKEDHIAMEPSSTCAASRPPCTLLVAAADHFH